jgi:hypothetical protein
MARKLSIALAAVVLAIFAGLPSLGHAQVRGGGFHGGGFYGDGWGWGPGWGSGWIWIPGWAGSGARTA